MNNQKTMDYNSQTGVLSCAFNFMQLKRIKRNSDKKATEVLAHTYKNVTKKIDRNKQIFTPAISNLCTISQYWIQSVSLLNQYLVKWPIGSNTDL